MNRCELTTSVNNVKYSELVRVLCSDKDMLVSLVRKALKMFTRTKSQLNSKHEYAVMLLGENASWVNN